MPISITVNFKCATCPAIVRVESENFGHGKSRWQLFEALDTITFKAVFNEIAAWKGEYPKWTCGPCSAARNVTNKILGRS